MSPSMTDRRPAVLSEAGVHPEWTARPLLDAGMTLQTCSLAEVPQRLASGRYNVLLLGRYYTLRHTKQQEDALLAELATALRDFMAKGGGVFFALPSGGVLSYDELLAPYGVQILTLGMRQEEQSIIEGSDIDPIIYAYTTAVSPVIGEGIEGVWYPAMMGHGLATRPVYTRAEDGWQVFLAGGESSHTDREHVGGGNCIISPDGTVPDFAQSVPLLAGRQVGAGRLAVCGIPSGYNIDSPHNFPLGKQFLIDGFQGTPSGMTKLLVNLTGWLAAPSAESSALGGAPSSAEILEPNVPRFPDDPPVLWAKRPFPPDDPAPRRGLIGARTSYSTGTGTVADYVARAKAQGLDFLVFLEDGAHLTEETFAALKADCAAHSSADFLAVPGFTMDDVANSHFFQFGPRMHFPPPHLRTPDGTRFAPAERPTGPNKNLLSAHCSYVFGGNGPGVHLRRGRYGFADSQTLFEDQRFCDSIALVTWQQGRLVDDVRERYRRLEAQHLRYNPTVLTFMESPEELDLAMASGWRNVFLEPYASLPDQVLRKHMAPELEWWGMLDEAEIAAPRYRLDHWQYGPPSHYITQGPEILAWTASVTSRDPSWRAPDTEIPPVGDPFRVDVLGFRLRVKVTSGVGLAEVRLYDGERLWRRWQCAGAAVFEQELDILHAQQMHLLLEARDVDGHVAITQDYPTLRLDWCEFSCADRNNPLSIGFGKDEQGLAAGWASTLYLTYNEGPWGGSWRQVGRWWYPGDLLSPVPHDPVHDVITPLDGGISPPGASLHIFPQLPPLSPPEWELMVTSQPCLISPDVAIDELTADHGYDPAWPYFFGRERTSFGCFPAHPTRYLTVTRRATVFRPRPHAVTCLLHEYRLAVKQELGMTTPLRLGWLDGMATHILHQRDGTTIEIPGIAETAWSIPWRQGESLISWTDGRRPAIFFNDGPDLLLVRDTTSPPEDASRTAPQRGLVTIHLPVAAIPTVATPCRLRFLAMGGEYDVQHPDVGQQLWQAMGMCGTPAYRLQMETGDVLSRRLLLRLDGRGTGVACRISQTDLPMALPVLVEGMNARWPVFLVDRVAHRWRPLGVSAGTAYATIDTCAQDWELFIGHPLTASDPEVVLNLVPISETDWTLEVHNPTALNRTVTVMRSPYFTYIDWDGDTLTLKAGSSQVLRLSAGAC